MRDIASIVGLKVISSSEGRDVGTVSQVVVSLATGEIQGLILGTGAGERGVKAEDLQVIGTDAIMVEHHRVARHLSELPELLEKRRDPGAVAREVVTDSGRKLGTLATVYVDPATRRVTRYEVSGGAWRDMTEGVLSLAPVAGTVDGRDLVVVPTAAFAEVGASTGGLKAQLAKLGELARAQAKQAAESLEDDAQSIQKSAAQVAKKASTAAASVAEKASTAAASVAEKATETATSVAGKASEAAGKLRDQAGKALKHGKPDAPVSEAEAAPTEPVPETPCCCGGEVAPEPAPEPAPCGETAATEVPAQDAGAPDEPEAPVADAPQTPKPRRSRGSAAPESE